MNKRIITIFLAMIMLLTLSLTACGANGQASGDATTAAGQTSAAQATSADSEPVTIKLMHRFPDDPYQSFIDKVCQQYMAEHPNVTIEQTSAATDPYKEKLTVLMSNPDETPDVFFGFTGEYLNQFIREGKVLDLTPYWEADKTWADSYIPSLMPSFYTDNKLYGVPFRVSVKMFFYNTAIFEEVGVQPPKTWSELIDVCQKLDAAGYIPIGEGDADQWAATHYLAILNARFVPDDIRKADYNPKTGEWTDPGYVQAMQHFQELIPYLSPNVTGQKHEMGRQQFAMGQAAMMFAESVEIPYVEAAMEGGEKIEYGMFGFPTVEGAKGNQTAILGAPEGFSVFSGSKNKEVAVDFLKYLCGQEVGRQEATEIKWFNGCKDTIDPETADQKLVDCYNVMSTAKDVVNWMDNEVHAQLRTVYYEDTQTFLNGDMTPEQFMDKIRTVAAEVKKEFN